MPESTMLIFGAESQEVRGEPDVLSDLLPYAEASVLVLGRFHADRVEHIAADANQVTMADADLTSKKAAALSVSGNVTVATFGPEHIEAEDGSIDAVVMVDALYRVPAMLMDKGMAEIGRVLHAEGLLYVSEPVFEGPLNELTVRVQDDERERLAAFEALREVIQAGQFELERELFFRSELTFESFEAFAGERLQSAPGLATPSPTLLDQARELFEKHRCAEGGYAVEAFRRVDLLRKL